MAKLNEQGIKEQIKTSSFFNAYLIYGEESYLKDFYISQIIKRLLTLHLIPLIFIALRVRIQALTILLRMLRCCL